MSERFGNEFESLEALPTVVLLHAGKPAMVLPLFLGRKLNG